jgi:hypothetical protein
MDRIAHSSHVDIGGGRRGFRSKDTVAGVPGTVATATHLNAVQEEIMAVIEAAGLVPSGANLAQLLGATHSQAANYRAAGGTANALTFSSVAGFEIAAYLPGQVFRFVTGANPSTGACTFKADALAAVPLVKRNGGALVAGDLPADTAFEGIYIAGSVRLLEMVASDIAAQKALTNVQTRTTSTRVSMTGNSGNGYEVTAWLPASYDKKSATSNIVLWLAANSFTPGATGSSAAKLSFGAQTIEALASNALPGTSTGATVINRVLTGLASGAQAIALSYKRYDGSGWTSVFSPTNSDAAYLPATSVATLIIGEVEP